MPRRIQADGAVIEVPDGTPDSAIASLLKQRSSRRADAYWGEAWSEEPALAKGMVEAGQREAAAAAEFQRRAHAKTAGAEFPGATRGFAAGARDLLTLGQEGVDAAEKVVRGAGRALRSAVGLPAVDFSKPLTQTLDSSPERAESKASLESDAGGRFALGAARLSGEIAALGGPTKLVGAPLAFGANTALQTGSVAEGAKTAAVVALGTRIAEGLGRLIPDPAIRGVLGQGVALARSGGIGGVSFLAPGAALNVVEGRNPLDTAAHDFAMGVLMAMTHAGQTLTEHDAAVAYRDAYSRALERRAQIHERVANQQVQDVESRKITQEAEIARGERQGPVTPDLAPTPERAAQALQEALQAKIVAPEEVVSREVQAGLRAGETLQEAVKRPRPRRKDGSNGEGYSATPNVEPGAKKVVEKAQRDVGPTVSSGQESPVTGEPWALAIDRKTGEPVRVEPDAPKRRLERPKPPVGEPPPPGSSKRLPGESTPDYLRRTDPARNTVEMGALSAMKRPVEWVYRQIERLASGSRSMVKRAGDAAGLGPKLQKAADEKRAVMGDWADAERKVLEARGIGPLGPRARERARLEQPEQRPGKDYGVAPLVDIVERRGEARTPVEREMVDSVAGLIDARGRTFEADQIMVPERGTDRMVPFKNHDGVFPRVPTALLKDIYANPMHPRRAQAIDAFAAENEMPRAEAKAIFEEQAKEYGARGSVGERTAQAEHRRFFKRVPTHLLVDGRWEPIYETRIKEYAHALTEDGSTRIGFTRAFGQNFALDSEGRLLRNQSGEVHDPIFSQDETQKPPSLLMRYGKETGRLDRGAESLKAAQAQPVEERGTSSVAQEDVSAVGKAALGLYKAGKLSATALYNQLEPLLQIPKRGLVPVLQAYGETVGSALQRLSGGRLGNGLAEKFKALERHGAIDVEHRPSTHMFVQRNVARAAQLHAERMQRQGRDRAAIEIDAGRLRGQGYDRATAERMASGQGTPTEYRDYVNRAVPESTGNRITPQEQTRLEHVRLLRLAFPIMRFATRQLAIVGNAGKALGKVRTWREAVAAAKYAGETGVSAGVIGAGQYLVSALALGGIPGLIAWWNRVKEDPREALAHGFMGNSVGGPAGSLITVARGDRDLAGAIMPVAMAREAMDVLNGNGRYKDMTWAERATVFAKGAVPALRVGETALVGVASMFGADTREQEWRESIKAYRAWKRDAKVPDSGFFKENPGDADEQFTSAMRRAYRAILANKDPDDVWDLIESALAVPGKTGANLKSSLEARLLLDDEVLKRRDALKSRIGERAYAALEAHDALLKSMIEASGTRRSRKREGGRTRPPPPVDQQRLREAIGR